MQLRDLYIFENADFDHVLYNLNGETNIKKYLQILIKSNIPAEAYDLYLQGNIDEAYRLIHGLKGASLNLSLNNFYIKCDNVCKSLKQRDVYTNNYFIILLDKFEKLKNNIIEIL